MTDILLSNFIPGATADAVDVERDRRLAVGFTYAGKLFQADERSISRMNGAAVGASIAVQSGAQPGDLYWADKATPFAWIAADNSVSTMDAPTVIEFCQTAMAFVSFLTFTARSLKDRIRSGERIIDIKENALWIP